jgi:hypothetical protein
LRSSCDKWNVTLSPFSGEELSFPGQKLNELIDAGVVGRSWLTIVAGEGGTVDDFVSRLI